MTVTVILYLTTISGSDNGHFDEEYNAAYKTVTNNDYVLQYPDDDNITSLYIRGIAEVAPADNLGNKEVEVAIPRRYANELNYYVHYLNSGIVTDNTADPLFSLDFARYMEDADYTEKRIDNLFRHWSLVKDTVYNQIDDVTFAEIMLRAPYDFLPDSYRRNKEFRNLWFNSNYDRKVYVSDNSYYHVNFPTLSRYLTGFVSGNKPVDYTERPSFTNFYVENGKKQGIERIFDRNQDFYLEYILNYVDDKKEGLEAIYNQNGFISGVRSKYNNVNKGPILVFTDAGVIDTTFVVDRVNKSRFLSEIFAGLDDGCNRLVTSSTRPQAVGSCFDLGESLQALGYPNLDNRWDRYYQVIEDVYKINKAVSLSNNNSNSDTVAIYELPERLLSYQEQ